MTSRLAVTLHQPGVCAGGHVDGMDWVLARCWGNSKVVKGGGVWRSSGSGKGEENKSQSWKGAAPTPCHQVDSQGSLGE